MTGKIKSLSTMSPSGFITVDNGRNVDLSPSGFIRVDKGQNVYFHGSAVLPPGVGALSVGQMVTFDLDGSKWPSAINVRVRPQEQPTSPQPPRELPASPQPPRELPAGTYLQYQGFQQTGNIRTYRFAQISRGEATQEFIVSIDLGIFAKHHVGIQEGPALALGRLRLSISAHAPAAPALAESQWLTEADLLAHLASRPAPGKTRGPKRNPRTSAATAE